MFAERAPGQAVRMCSGRDAAAHAHFSTRFSQCIQSCSVAGGDCSSRTGGGGGDASVLCPRAKAHGTAHACSHCRRKLCNRRKRVWVAFSMGEVGR